MEENSIITSTTFSDYKPAPEYKLYSKQSILSASFIGSPIAAMILIRVNLIRAGKEKEGNRALIIGSAFTVALFAILLMMPETVSDKIPNFIIPALYTAAIAFYIKDSIEAQINRHKEEKGLFYSGWRAAGIGAICLVGILAILVIGSFATTGTGLDSEQYNAEMARFVKNEDRALHSVELLNAAYPNKDSIISSLTNTGIPLWKENIRILTALGTNENLTSEGKQLNRSLMEYSKLRLQTYQMYLSHEQGDTTIDQQLLLELNNKMEQIVTKLNGPQ